jgi:hypothetical protein
MHLWHTNDTHAHVKKVIKCPIEDWKLTQHTQHKQAHIGDTEDTTQVYTSVGRVS